MYELTEKEFALHGARAAEIDRQLQGLDPESYAYFALSRRKTFGGSDAGRLRGFWGSPRSLWEDKTGRRSKDLQSLQMRVGTFCEELVAQLYAERTGYEVVKARTLVNSALPYLASNYDRLVMKDGEIIGGLECKTCGHNVKTYDPLSGTERYKWGAATEFDENGQAVSYGAEIDPSYYPQVQFYLMTSGLPWWDTAVLISNSELKIYRIMPDAEYQAALLHDIHDFWVNNVLADTPPAVVFGDISTEPFVDTAERPATEAEIELCTKIKELDGSIKGLEEQRKSLLDELAPGLENFSVLTYVNADGKSRRLCTYKSSVQSRFDSKAFQAENPELYERYKRPVTMARTLRISL